MPTRHTVAKGECIASLSARYGFADWQVIWNHPDNAELKQRRPKPGVLFEGDVVTIPDRTPKEEERETGKKHRFKVKLPQATVRIEFIIQGSWKYELSVGKETFSGSVPSGSPIEHPIDPAATDATLLVWPDKGDDEAREGLLTYPIQLGYLDPVDEVSGVQGMLTNLGYYWGSLDGVLNDATKVAIQAFQKDSGITITGTVDDGLKGKLKEKHDG